MKSNDNYALFTPFPNDKFYTFFKLKEFADDNYSQCFQKTCTANTLVFTCLQYKSIENTVGKGEIARNEQFLLFP